MSKSCLVIMIGNARGGEITWNTAYKHLIDINNADLAVCFGQTTDYSSSLYKKSKYVWEIIEYDNWRSYYEQYLNNFWEKSLRIGVDYGLMGPIDNHAGSAAIQFAIKHFILHNHISILQQYNRIIITRSDQFYALSNKLKSENFVWIPEGEDYGGICDRHIEFHSKYAIDILDIFQFIDSEIGFNILYKNKSKNPESLLHNMYLYKNLPIRRYPRTQFTVATSKDTTRWKKAIIPLKTHTDIYIKYIDEFRITNNNIQKLQPLKNFMDK